MSSPEPVHKGTQMLKELQPDNTSRTVGSFKIALLPAEFDQALDPEFWDEGVLAAEFTSRRRREGFTRRLLPDRRMRGDPNRETEALTRPAVVLDSGASTDNVLRAPAPTVPTPINGSANLDPEQLPPDTIAHTARGSGSAGGSPGVGQNSSGST
ncbi:hypothetical protein DMENIID0001_053230 [Sergentomyia squamirostris]